MAEMVKANTPIINGNDSHHCKKVMVTMDLSWGGGLFQENSLRHVTSKSHQPKQILYWNKPHGWFYSEDAVKRYNTSKIIWQARWRRMKLVKRTFLGLFMLDSITPSVSVWQFTRSWSHFDQIQHVHEPNFQTKFLLWSVTNCDSQH